MAHNRQVDDSIQSFKSKARPAVQARSQADKFTYHLLAKETLEKQSNLALFQDTVVDLLISSDKSSVVGVKTQEGMKLALKLVVLTTGTFMEEENIYR